MRSFPEATALGIGMRPMGDADFPFTETLYASTRAEEVAQTGWPEELCRAFLAQQHAAQHAHYQKHYHGMEALILERDAIAIGRLYLLQSANDLRIVDISLLPQARRLGIGSAILRDVLAGAAARGSGVSIHVERNNPARALYARFGFEPTRAEVSGEVYDLWKWPGAANR
ncbi:GNAT family N-acetyltransferase [Sphingomonas sp. LT1P40]|uniref:GNAT family N-acetyltransferase n=1 Tax=Alteristakelama amylovorans TaxID=3096166 RepID=UPI002FC660EF